MPEIFKFLAIVFACLLCLGGVAVAQDVLGQEVGKVPVTATGVYALTGGTVHVGDGQVLENATVLVRDGLIEAVGSDLTVPVEAFAVDASGLHIYPGIIDALSPHGLKKPEGQRGEGQSGPGRGPGAGQPEDNPEGPGLYSYVQAASRINPQDSRLDSLREAGITAIHVAPDEGIFQGQTAVISVSDVNPASIVIASPIAMKMSWQGLGFRTYPGSLMGVIAHVKQTLLDARHYDVHHEMYRQNPRGLRRPETNRALEALQPVVHGQMPLLFPAVQEREIARVLELGREYQVKTLIAGGHEAAPLAEELKAAGTSVLIDVDFPEPPRNAHPEAEESLRDIKQREAARKVASELNAAGVPFAFYGGKSANDYKKGVRTAMEAGLPAEAALQAATLSAARILGVDGQLGSIEEGKIANLVVADGELFGEKTAVRHVFVDGIKYDIPEKKEPETTDPGAPTAQMTGIWEATVTTPEQMYALTLDLTQDGSDLTGEVRAPMFGSLPIFDGSVGGNSFSFKIQTDLGQGLVDISFAGTVTGDTFVGTATPEGIGPAEMEGRRVP